MRIAASLGASITDGGSNGVSITPGAPGGFTSVTTLYDQLGNALASMGGPNSIGLGGPFSGSGSGPAATYTYGPFNAFPPLMVDCFQFGSECGEVRTRVTFTASGGSDRFAFTGGADITAKEATPEPVPEPGTTAALVGVGLLGLASRKRKDS
ncbi:PEP-CTERM sorting domain-containing protein [Crocosphaera sp. XPORK-15E]|uniref:PEP-CTERM sorting domain-containing protein n=1 Tax=Crocosphaera sp. XPORK-15E TaxID=3110247 RepID=UPI003A4D78A4